MSCSTRCAVAKLLGSSPRAIARRQCRSAFTSASTGIWPFLLSEPAASSNRARFTCALLKSRRRSALSKKSRARAESCRLAYIAPMLTSTSAYVSGGMSTCSAACTKSSYRARAPSRSLAR
eukprot:scaffold5651_cov108-Isochrysis_galbana.AAC.1